jgi:hypothetical protein
MKEKNEMKEWRKKEEKIEINEWTNWLEKRVLNDLNVFLFIISPSIFAFLSFIGHGFRLLSLIGMHNMDSNHELGHTFWPIILK